MNKKYSFLAVMVAILSLFTSCLGDDTVEIVYYDDVAITSFSLGDMKRTAHTTTSAGNDSVYYATVTGANYKFSIDHLNGLIYNVDSLPVGTNVTKCVPTVDTYNSGIAFIKSLASDSVTVISSADSIDFSKERIITVLANDGQHTKEYKVNVRIHTEEADKMYWTKKATNDAIGAMTDINSFCLGGKVYVYGMNGGVKMYSSAIGDGTVWNDMDVPFQTIPSVAVCGTKAYALADAKLYTLDADGKWNAIADAIGVKTLISATVNAIYALSADGKIVVTTNGGRSWEYDEMDSDAAYLPQNNISSVHVPSRTNADVERIILMGTRDNDTDKTAVVWSKVVDNAMPQNSQPWMYQPFESSTWHHAPRYDRMSVVKYGDAIFMLGANKEEGDQSVIRFRLHYSLDGGLNWLENTKFSLPDELRSSTTAYSMVVDNDSHIWLFCGITGDVWRCHYSTWSWK